MNTSNSTRTVWVNTHRVTLAEYEADVRYPLETLRQGRDAKNSVPRISMLSGIPEPAKEPRSRLDVAIVLAMMVASALASIALMVAFVQRVTQ